MIAGTKPNQAGAREVLRRRSQRPVTVEVEFSDKMISRRLQEEPLIDIVGEATKFAQLIQMS